MRAKELLATTRSQSIAVPNDIRQHIFHIGTRYTTDTAGVKIEEIHDGIVTDRLETVCQKRTYIESVK